MSIDHTEIEWQFDAADLDIVRRWLESHAFSDGLVVQPGEVRRQVDTYFDTPDWRIFHAGYALRVRRLGARAEATLKSIVPAGQGARHRREISEDLDAGNANATALELLRRASGDVGRRVKALAGTRPVRKLFELHTERHVYKLLIQGESAGELALDETRIVAQPRGKQAHLRRVEVEVPDDNVAGLRAFVDALRQACELRRAIATKFESGLMAQRLVPDPPPHFGSTTVEKKASAGELALAVLRKQFAAFLNREAGVRLDEDIEDVHQMRLAGRRLRAALKLFGKVLPSQITDLAEDVKWIGDLLGEVRDLDVQMEWLSAEHLQEAQQARDRGVPETEEPAVAPAPKRANGTREHVLSTAQAQKVADPAVAEREAPQEQLGGLEVLRGLLEEKRKAAHDNLMRALNTPRYEHFRSRMGALLRHPPKAPDKAGRSIYKVAPGLFRSYYRTARKLGDTLDSNSMPADYHALRIKLKYVRYCLEFVKGCYGKPAKRMLKRVEDLADMLGEYHDMQVAVQQFREWREVPAQNFSPDARATLDALAWHSAAHAEELKAQFPDMYAQLSGKDLQRLCKVMKKKR